MQSSIMKISPAQMARWRAMESEHSKSKVAQERIVRQHIAEHGPHYYPYLIRMERLLKRKYG